MRRARHCPGFDTRTPRERLQDRLDYVRFEVKHAGATRWGAGVDHFGKFVRIVRWSLDQSKTRWGRAYNLRVRLHRRARG